MHRGEQVRQAVDNSGVSITRIAKALDVSRRTVYNWMDDPQMDHSRVEQIGKVIKVDFTEVLESYQGSTFGSIASIQSPDWHTDNNLIKRMLDSHGRELDMMRTELKSLVKKIDNQRLRIQDLEESQKNIPVTD
jgi:predicted transcriptional regulator